MKLKDIEKNLKRENDVTSVPDVYARASKAPLNKLLTGETPARAFQKRLVMSLLIFVIFIFLTLAVGLSAIWLTPAKSPSSPNCYVAITVSREDGNERIGVLMNGEKSISCIVAEMTAGVVNTEPNVSHSLRISEFISAQSGDKVSVGVISADRTLANGVVKTLREELNLAYGEKDFEVAYSINLPSTRDELASYLRQCGYQTETGGADELIKAYAVLFE